MGFASDFGSNLKAARKAIGMTQTALGQTIGKTATCICQYENGDRMPNLMLLRDLADVLGMSLDDLVPEHVNEHVMPCEGQMDIYDVMEEN